MFRWFSILQYFRPALRYLLSLRLFFCLFLSGLLKTGFTVSLQQSKNECFFFSVLNLSIVSILNNERIYNNKYGLYTPCRKHLSIRQKCVAVMFAATGEKLLLQTQGLHYWGGTSCYDIGAFNLNMHIMPTVYLRNEFDFWNIHGFMNTSGLLQSK